VNRDKTGEADGMNLDGDDKTGAKDSDLIVVVEVLLVVVDELSDTRSPGGAVTAAERYVV